MVVGKTYSYPRTEPMADQTYNVRYNIEVESTNATRQLGNFTQAVQAMSRFNSADMSGAITNVTKAMASIDKLFKADKKGQKRNYNYTFNIDTKSSEAKLSRVLGIVNQIEAKSKGIKLVVNPGKALDTKAIGKNAEQAIARSKAMLGNLTGRTHTTQTSLTRSIGKINSALTHLGRGRELNIKTDAAKARLNEILGMLRQIGAATGRGMNLGVAGGARNAISRTGAPYRSARVFMLPRSAQAQLARGGLTTPPSPYRSQTTERAQALAAQRAAAKATQAQNVQIVRDAVRMDAINDRMMGSRQRAAINRLQYSRPPSIRNMLPFAYMLNGYMLFSTMKSQMKEAVEYANIMESARSILRVADRDLGTFETRFTKMAQNVRQVGIETKFTAVEVGGAVKFLAMAGQGITEINESIRPITNLALIGDNDIARVADLTTNIMAGYDVDPKSMPIVADIIASTISRSNVNIIETAESFKMAAGYLRMAGIDFSESSAAIGILGNVGLKGTMSGTSLRSIATRLAHQPREAQKILEKLGVRFTHYVNVYGERLEKIRPLADIFEDLKNKGATLGDMTKIFGRWGANAGMALMLNTDRLRRLTADNRASHGISGELAKVKQETTKGLWYQMTSTFSEMFMRGYEIMEPQVQRTLRKITASFNTEKFAKGLASLATAIIDILSLLVKFATWVANNFRWLEPILFTGFVATRLFKLAGAITNLGVAFGFLGKQSAAATGLQMLAGLTGIGGSGALGRLTFGDKRNVVTALRNTGVTGGRGALTSALAGAGVQRTMMGLGTRQAASGMFASQVATGRGIVGAGAAIGTLGTGAVIATGAVAALAGALGWVAYKTWKVKEASDAAFADLQEERQYNYPSIEALYRSLHKTYTTALNAKIAVDDLTSGKTLKETTGLPIGAWTGNWWTAFMSNMSRGSAMGGYGYNTDTYSFQDAYRDDLTRAIIYQADSDGAKRIQRIYADLGRLRDQTDIQAFINTIPTIYGYDFSGVNRDLYSHYSDTSRTLKRGQKNMTDVEAAQTWEYQNRMNEQFVPEALLAAKEYQRLMQHPANARGALAASGFNFDELKARGFSLNRQGIWEQNPLRSNATTEEKEAHLTNSRLVHNTLVTMMAALRQRWQSAEIAENILQKAGFQSYLYSNEPDRRDMSPWTAPDISVTGSGEDDDGAGGNYSGSGKLSSAAPKQVIVNITNLLSIETVELLRSGSGNQPEIQDLKEQMAQALIDVVHDFDASWNGA
jgi:TP901 family phage tail tape measure protein